MSALLQGNEWDWLFAGTRAAGAAPVHTDADDEDDDLDFLDEPTQAAPVLEVLAPMPTDHPRWQTANSADVGAWTARLHGAWDNWTRDPRTAEVDAAAARLLCAALLGIDKAEVTAFGPVSTLLRRAVTARDEQTWRNAAQVIAKWRVTEAQSDVADQLGRYAARGDTLAVDILLDCLQAIGDGRCVRAMESVLADHGNKLGDHQAWRARHIVQAIRRGGRR